MFNINRLVLGNRSGKCIYYSRLVDLGSLLIGRLDVLNVSRIKD
jgi:hypothetical protein